jgi:predicted ArsR family transcriptional regulator
MSTISEKSDRALIDFLRRNGPATIAQLVEELGVTATAVRQRLARLTREGIIAREAWRQARGRPNHRYSLTEKGEQHSGTNFNDLAIVLWEEMKAIDDPAVRRGLLKRIAERFMAKYRGRIAGESLSDRMASVAGLMNERAISFEVDATGPLPVLSALSCPYPELAKLDRGVCTMEKLMLSTALGENVRLSQCRLDGASCCTFTPSQALDS